MGGSLGLGGPGREKEDEEGVWVSDRGEGRRAEREGVKVPLAPADREGPGSGPFWASRGSAIRLAVETTLLVVVSECVCCVCCVCWVCVFVA